MTDVKAYGVTNYILTSIYVGCRALDARGMFCCRLQGKLWGNEVEVRTNGRAVAREFGNSVRGFELNCCLVTWSEALYDVTTDQQGAVYRRRLLYVHERPDDDVHILCCHFQRPSWC